MKDKVARLEAEARKDVKALEESARTVMAFQESMKKQGEKLEAEVWARKGLIPCIKAVTISLNAVATEMEGRGKPGIPGSFVTAMCDYLDMLVEEE
jgi:hypothetical protein